MTWGNNNTTKRTTINYITTIIILCFVMYSVTLFIAGAEYGQARLVKYQKQHVVYPAKYFNPDCHQIGK